MDEPTILNTIDLIDYNIMKNTLEKQTTASDPNYWVFKD